MNNEFVMVPRELLEKLTVVLSDDPEHCSDPMSADYACKLQSLLAQPAAHEQHQGDHKRPDLANLATLLLALAQKDIRVSGGKGEEPWIIEPAAQHHGEPVPITVDMHRLMEAYRAGEFKAEGGSDTIEALAVASFDAVESHGHDADSYMAGYSAALHEQSAPFIWLSIKPQHQGEPVAYIRQKDIDRLLSPHVAGCAANLEKEPRDGFIPFYTNADTGEVEVLREELEGLKEIGKLQAEALKGLIFAARTTGGTAGPDHGLRQACEKAEHAISLGGIGRAYMKGADATLSASAEPSSPNDDDYVPTGIVEAALYGHRMELPSDQEEVVCRGDRKLGTACGKCSRCKGAPVEPLRVIYQSRGIPDICTTQEEDIYIRLEDTSFDGVNDDGSPVIVFLEDGQGLITGIKSINMKGWKCFGPDQSPNIGLLQEVAAATKARRDLSAEIRAAGRPPHTDYWHQSIGEADARIDAALAALDRKP